jgi:hypothetical protein
VHVNYVKKEQNKEADSTVGYPVPVSFIKKNIIRRLIEKLSAAGIRGNMLRWISDWLTDRKQRVIVTRRFSGWRAVLSGVPQGSVLGPILFNIFINDLDDEATVRQILKKFADDTKVGQIIEQNSDCVELQATLDGMCNLAHKWSMSFNGQNC